MPSHIEYRFDHQLDARLPFFEKLPVWKQVHGIHVAEVLAPNQQCGDADGLATSLAQQPVGILTADCVPILLHHRDGSRVAALHSGWRGTIAHLAKAFIQSEKADAKEWIAILGPSIRSCCYEVSTDLIDSFALAFPDAPRSEWNPIPRHLDLPNLIQWELRQLSVEVRLEAPCTYCNLEWQSYRRNKTPLRQFSWILRRN